MNSSDFVAGDMVVFIDASKPDHLMTIFQVQKNGVLLNGNNNFALNHLIRRASIFEISAKKRHTVSIDELFEELNFGDDAHIENHISPLCKQRDNLNNMESCYIEKKQQVEMLQTEVARLNAIIERGKTEKLAMQIEVNKFNTISIGLHKSRDQAYKHLGSCENSLNSQTIRFDELSQKISDLIEIINNPDNYYVPFYCVAEQIQSVLGEAKGEVA